MRPTTSSPARTVAGAAATLLLLAAAGCGGAEEEAPASGGEPEAQESAAPSASSPSPSTSPSASSGASPSSSAGPSASASAATELTASVGTAEDPDAYVISLVDGDGQEVTELPAGDYTISVDDPSSIHNVHLTGGGVDESTSVPEMTTTTWQVTLEAGDYTYVCDPHPDMVGSFTVT